MAITLNKYAIRCEEIALASGRLSSDSSARPLIYDISRNWRKLLTASKSMQNTDTWSEKELAAGEVIISAMTYLQRIDCKNIEQLLRDTIERHARLNE